MFSTEQAANALCLSAIGVRRYRIRKGMGTMEKGGTLSWTLQELEGIRRIQANRWKLPKWELKYSIKQLSGPPLPGTMIMWATTVPVAESKAAAWFWNALMKEEPQRWGTPVAFDILDARAIDYVPPTDPEPDNWDFSSLMNN